MVASVAQHTLKKSGTLFRVRMIPHKNMPAKHVNCQSTATTHSDCRCHFSHKGSLTKSGVLSMRRLCISLLFLTSVSAFPFEPANFKELQNATKECLRESPPGACITHGSISTWDTSKVTSLHKSKSACRFLIFFFAHADPFL